MVSVSGLSYNSSTIESVYGKSVVNIPTRYEFVDFRPPREGDKFLFNGGTNIVLTAGEYWRLKDKPRIIVRQISQIEETLMTSHKKCFTKIWTIKEIYGEEDPKIPWGFEAIEFRPVNYEEDYLVQSGTKDFWDLPCPSAKPFLILRKQKKLYAKIPLTSLVNYESYLQLQFINSTGCIREIDVSKNIEIIEE